MSELVYLTANINAARVERKLWNGRWFLVAPGTILKQGVLAGNRGPLYYPNDEIGRDTAQWDMRPLVHDHPRDAAGNYISANAPGVLDTAGLGYIRFPQFDDARGLRVQYWFDEDNTRERDPHNYDNLKNGRPIEVSTGLKTNNRPAQNGARDPRTGRAYTAVARDYEADHVAALPAGHRGACSVDDGCGVLVNKKFPLRVPNGHRVAANAKDALGHGSDKRDEGGDLPDRSDMLRQMGGSPHSVTRTAAALSRKADRIGTTAAHLSAGNAHLRAVAKHAAAGRHDLAQQHAAMAAYHQQAPTRNAKGDGLPSEELDISPEKACQILRDGSVHGKELTEAQRGMFGAKCGKSEKKKTNNSRLLWSANANPEGCNQYKPCGGGGEGGRSAAEDGGKLADGVEKMITKKGSAVGFTAQGDTVTVEYRSKIKAWRVDVTTEGSAPLLTDPRNKNHATKRAAAEYAASLIDPIKSKQLAWFPLHYPTANANPEGCNQHTGPGCGGGGSSGERDNGARDRAHGRALEARAASREARRLSASTDIGGRHGGTYGGYHHLQAAKAASAAVDAAARGNLRDALTGHDTAAQRHGLAAAAHEAAAGDPAAMGGPNYAGHQRLHEAARRAHRRAQLAHATAAEKLRAGGVGKLPAAISTSVTFSTANGARNMSQVAVSDHVVEDGVCVNCGGVGGTMGPCPSGKGERKTYGALATTAAYHTTVAKQKSVIADKTDTAETHRKAADAHEQAADSHRKAELSAHVSGLGAKVDHHRAMAMKHQQAANDHGLKSYTHNSDTTRPNGDRGLLRRLLSWLKGEISDNSTANADESMEDRLDEVRQAFREDHAQPMFDPYTGERMQDVPYCHLRAVYDDYVIYEEDGELYRQDYADDETTGEVVFGAITPVEVEYVPTTENPLVEGVANHLTPRTANKTADHVVENGVCVNCGGEGGTPGPCPGDHRDGGSDPVNEATPAARKASAAAHSKSAITLGKSSFGRSDVAKAGRMGKTATTAKEHAAAASEHGGAAAIHGLLASHGYSAAGNETAAKLHEAAAAAHTKAANLKRTNNEQSSSDDNHPVLTSEEPMSLTADRKKEIIAGLTANCACKDGTELPWKGKDAAALDKMPDDVLLAFNAAREIIAKQTATAAATTTTTNTAQPPAAAPPAVNVDELAAAVLAKIGLDPKTVVNKGTTLSREEWLNQAPPEVREAFYIANEVAAQKKHGIITRLTANIADEARRKTKAEELAKLDTSALEGMLELLPPAQTANDQPLPQQRFPTLYTGIAGGPPAAAPAAQKGYRAKTPDFTANREEQDRLKAKATAAVGATA